MKRFLFISLLYLISFSVLAQKVTVQFLKAENPGLISWQIVDNQNSVIISGIDYLLSDTAKKADPINSLCTLILNGEPLLYIKSNVGPGDHFFPFFTGVRSPNAKIVGGSSTVISNFPWQVYYISGNFRCGGSILSGKWVITAAHCTKNASGGATPASEMFVQVGANNPVNNPNDGKTYAVSQVIVNEGFDSQTLLNDIALLQLTDSINFPNAVPIKIVTNYDVAAGAIDPGVMAWITGWGLTRVNPSTLPSNLQEVLLPIVSDAQASTVWSSIPATDIMAGYLNGNKDACNGDSGGPLVVPVLNEYKLAGLVSWGSTNCNTYGAYTNVSDFEAWIQTNTGIAYDFRPPPPVGDSIICQGTESSQYSIGTVAGATNYEWNLLPANAGVITGNASNASVIWNIAYTGPINVIVRITVNNKVSDWSRLDGNVVLNTKLLSQSRDTAICAAKPVTLSVNVQGHNLIYTWSKNGQTVQSGTSSKLIITNAAISNSGTYICTISGSCGTVISNNIQLTVYTLTNITYISPNVEVPFGSDVTLTVNSEGHDLSYIWQKDGVPLNNSDTSQYLIQNVNATNTGLYRTTVTGTCGVETSDSIYLYVKRANFKSDPEVFLWPSITSDQFSVALSTDAVYNIQIFSSIGKKIRELTNSRYQTDINISTLAKGIYIVIVYNNDFRKTIKVIKE
jgi:hypothetical protein